MRRCCSGRRGRATAISTSSGCIEAARQTGAEAIHPGYGFLSENAEFAQACAEAGLVFVGPTAAMMTAMGSKSGSKVLMEKAGVPLVPGYHGEAQDEATLAKAADKIGFPVLVKASAGGGGRGMRVVRSAGELAAAIVSAKREAKAAFGDDRMLIEKYRRQSPPHRGAGDRRQPRQSAVAVRARMHACSGGTRR